MNIRFNDQLMTASVSGTIGTGKSRMRVWSTGAIVIVIKSTGQVNSSSPAAQPFPVEAARAAGARQDNASSPTEKKEKGGRDMSQFIPVTSTEILERAYESVWRATGDMVEQGRTPAPLVNGGIYDISLILELPPALQEKLGGSLNG